MKYVCIVQRFLMALAFSAGLLGFGLAHADSWPDRQLFMVVPAPPGGGTDFLARLVAKGLTQQMGQNVVVQNISGANGNIGAAHVARARPDGYTVLMSYVGTQAINPTLYRHIDYDPQKDLIPVAMVAVYPFVVVVNPSVQANTLTDLVKLARSEPGKLNFGSAGIGSGGHLVGSTFASKEGIQLNHIPYAGSAPALTDLMGGRLQIMFDTLSTEGPYIRSGKLRALAVVSDARLPDYPQIPTMAEAGFPDIKLTGWYGVFVPRGTPQAVVDRLNTEIGKIVASADYQQKLKVQGYEPFKYLSAQQFQDFVNDEVVKWGSVVKASGAHVE